MKRKNTTIPNIPATAIITADNHLSETIPVSRIDDYLGAQKKKMLWLLELQKSQDDCFVLDGGDMFEFWKISPWLATRAFRLLPRNMITIPGNHDLPQHSMALYDKSGMSHVKEIRDDIQVLGITKESSLIRIQGTTGLLQIQGAPFGELENLKPEKKHNGVDRRVLLLHETVWFGKKPPWAGDGGFTSQEILRKYHKDYDLIITGDNHAGFVDSYENTILVNPGCMMRAEADKINYRPRCYLYYADTNTVLPQYYPIEKDAHDITYLNVAKEKEERLAAYISNMDKRWKIGISYRKNLEAFFQKNKTPKLIRELIWQYLEK